MELNRNINTTFNITEEKMTSDIFTQNGKITILTSKCIIRLHELLRTNYYLIENMEPVEPPGVKNINSLESAIYRQQTGFDNWYKYNNPFTNCSTLVFALIKNHAFHNGNKRVAFLGMIKHLYENGYVISPTTKHDNIYHLLIAIADNKLSDYMSKIDKKIYKQVKGKTTIDDETVINLLSQWLKKNSEAKNKTLKIKIRISTLKAILEKKNVMLEQNGGTWITTYQVKERKVLFGLFSNGFERYNSHDYGIGNSRSEVGIKVINQIRKDYDLKITDGFDNNAFYDDESFIDQEMLTYKKIIYKLSKT